MPVIDWALKNEGAMSALLAGTAAVVPIAPTYAMQGSVGKFTTDDGWDPEVHQNEIWKAMLEAGRLDKQVEAE